MPDYIPSPRQWVRDQVELYEKSGGTEGTTLRDTGLPVIIVTHTGGKTGAIRKTPLMRVKDGAHYVLVGSTGGASTNPVWVYNLRANPSVEIRDLAAGSGCASARWRKRPSAGGCGRWPWQHLRRTPSTRPRPRGGSRSSSQSRGGRKRNRPVATSRVIAPRLPGHQRHLRRVRGPGAWYKEPYARPRGGARTGRSDVEDAIGIDEDERQAGIVRPTVASVIDGAEPHLPVRTVQGPDQVAIRRDSGGTAHRDPFPGAGIEIGCAYGSSVR
jgi:deazaflavin-dependent oxidoreductase (nitroreductase family)